MIDGWKVVARKGEFQVNENVLYFEVDCFLPKADARFEFLMKNGVRTFEENQGHVLRTVRLRKQISQGLIQKIDIFPEILGLPIDMDFAEAIGIKKWEPTIDPSLAGQVKGAFPNFIKKTDQERCQNIVDEIFSIDNLTAEFEVSLKLDGMSVTLYSYNGTVGVCSRNLELKINEENSENALVKILTDTGLINHISGLGNIAIQGELMGPKIQDNREKLTKPTFFVFDIQNLDTGEYFSAEDRYAIMNRLEENGVKLLQAPILHQHVRLKDLGINNLDDLLDFAVVPSINNLVGEGLVFKRAGGLFSFKAISNLYLLNKKE